MFFEDDNVEIINSSETSPILNKTLKLATLAFHFTQGSSPGKKEISTFQFITDIKETFDITSSMCLGFNWNPNYKGL